MLAAFYFLFVAVPDVQAARLLYVEGYFAPYTNRADALLMDDSPAVRAALKRQVVARGLMLGYQANIFDDGFGSVCQGLRYAREAICRARRAEIPDIPIQRGKE